MGTVPGARLTGSQLGDGYYVAEIWNKEFMRIFDHVLCMLGCVNQDYAGDIKGKNDTVHIRQLGDITISEYKRNMDLIFQDLDEDKTTLTIDQQKYFMFKLDDLDQADMDVPVLQGYMKRAAVALAETIDTYLYTTCVAGALTANKIGTITNPVAIGKTNIYDYAVDCYGKLRTAKVLTPGVTPFMTIPVALESIIKKSDEFVETKTMNPGNALFKTTGATIGEFAGFQVKVMTNMAAYATGDKYKILFGTKQGCTYASKVAKVEKGRPWTNFADAVKGLYLYGAKVLYPECLGVLHADL